MFGRAIPCTCQRDAQGVIIGNFVLVLYAGKFLYFRIFQDSADVVSDTLREAGEEL